MKNLTTPNNSTDNYSESLISSAAELYDVVVYQEMADQPAVRLNLIQHIHLQMNQLDEMLGRKQFVLKEIHGEIVK